MIPILYKADAVDFSTFGISALSECTLCEVTEERNGAFECTFKYPVSGRLFSELKNERLIKAKPNDTSKEQLFRIYRITTPINGIVTIYAQHISYDLSNIAELIWSSAMISPSLAMSRLFTKTATTHNFKCSTDFSSAKPFSVSKPMSVRACLGGVEGSMLDLWGGEYEWDNFNVILHSKRGKDNGVVIEYGKNLTELEQDNDFTDVYTDILPYAVFSDESTEKVITLSEITLPIIDNPTRQKTLIKDFTEFFEDKASINENSLRNKAKNFIKANPLGVETPTLTVAFEPLWKQPEYSAILERVSLCDTVTIRHSALGITAKSKVIKTVYDALAEKYVSITLGSASYYSELIQSHPGWLYCGVFSDEAYTGTKDNRTGFQKLISECRAGNIDLIITKSISRFARNTVTLLETVRELKLLGIDVFFEEQNIHTISADGELMMTVLASYAQAESLSASENQKWRIRKAFENGEIVNLRFLFGYRINGAKIEIDPAQADIVREVFERAVNGESFTAIAKDLNNRSITRCLGGKWNSQRIRDLLSNEKYLGNALLQKKYRNNHLEKKLIHNDGQLPKYYNVLSL